MTQRTRYPRSVAEELDAAEVNFSTGNGGKARVCARRAVGFGISARFAVDPRYKGVNAMNAIKILRGEPDLPDEVVQALDDMVVRVDSQFNLPESIDLVASARIILDHLFPEDR